MKNHKLNFLIILLLFPVWSNAQIPEGHFIDADQTSERGYKLKPFIQEKEGVYHYAVLTELPFVNDCEKGLLENEQISCSEKGLRQLIYQQLSSVSSFKGNVNVYFTVTKDEQITNITVSSFPKSDFVNDLIKEAIKSIEVKAGKYNEKTVTSRLWTSLTFPSTSKELFSDSLKRMEEDDNPLFQNYENLIFDASQYIFSNPIYPNGTEFRAATKIISFWMNKDIGMGIPTFGNFFTALSNNNQQQYLYSVAMINYGLDQKLNHNRYLECKPKKGQKYSDQDDVREVQLEGAKILLDFIGNEENNVPMTSKTKKYFKAHKKNILKDKLFE